MGELIIEDFVYETTVNSGLGVGVGRIGLTLWQVEKDGIGAKPVRFFTSFRTPFYLPEFTEALRNLADHIDKKLK